MSEEKMSSSNIEAEFTDIVKKNAWLLLYQKLGRECQAYPNSIVEAKKPQNKPLNRYRDVSPYDHSRIILKRKDIDYINANLVKMERANRRYILTQGPLAFTVAHFWLMVWEQESRAILMLNKIVEKSELKCHQYWPSDSSTQMELPDVGLTVELVSSEDSNYYWTRRLRLTDVESQESREVIQFHYTTWPDFGVPGSPVAFLKFLERVRASGALESDVGPAVVHCSAGIGRSGTFCLVDSCLVIIEKEGLDSVNVQQILLELRKYRMGLIQTPDQLRFSYQAIIEGAKRLDPKYKEAADAENIYSTVAEAEAEAEETPPRPPTREGSLRDRRPPARPLPAIPASASADELNITGDTSQSDSEDSAPTPPRRPSPRPPPGSDDHEDNGDEDSDGRDPEDADGNENPNGRDKAGETPGVRQRRKNEELRERISTMKRRAGDAEWWQDFKRFKTGNPKETDPQEG